MADADLVLKFEIAPGRFPEADTVAEAIAAWVDVLRSAAEVVEPGAVLSVELVAVEPGSQMFRLALKRLEASAQRLRAGGEEFPLVSKAAMTLGGLIVASTVAVGVNAALQPDPRIPDDQMAVFQQMNRNLAESVDLQRKNERFWGIMQDEPAFEQVDVLRAYDMKPVYKVPRSEFAARSGLWSGEEDEALPETETRRVVWDVILVKPALVAEPRRWTFAREGLEFSALMTDKAVLEAIHNKTLPLRIAEGISMKVEIHYREKFDGQAWLPVAGSHRVKRVLSPTLPVTLGLFLAPGDP